MTIAELLVQTTTALVAADRHANRSSGPLSPTSRETIERAAADACVIVGAVYGLPCDSFITADMDTGGPTTNTGADPCDKCDWPRSGHKVQP